MDINEFVNITSRAWALPILSSLHEGVPGRQAPLIAATGAGRTAFAQSMDHLIKNGLIERNPGHGHPLRPEFRLTPQGIEAAALAHKVQSASPEKDWDLLRKTWTVPILSSLKGPTPFNLIKRNLTTITDRALSQSLQALEGRDWVSRTVNVEARPPKPMYEAVNAGALISQVTAAEVRF